MTVGSPRERSKLKITKGKEAEASVRGELSSWEKGTGYGKARKGRKRTYH